MMNKRILVGLVIAIILVVVGTLAAKRFAGNSVNTDLNTSENLKTLQNNPKTLKDILESSTAQTCTFSSPGEFATEGTIYANNNLVRGDFSFTTDGKAVRSHMIVRDNTSYIWTDGQNTGFKTSFIPSATAVAAPNNGESIANTFDANANLNYNCSAGVSDSSVFTLPSNIEFSDPADQLNIQCETCNNLTGDAKVQCQTALNCN